MFFKVNYEKKAVKMFVQKTKKTFFLMNSRIILTNMEINNFLINLLAVKRFFVQNM